MKPDFNFEISHFQSSNTVNGCPSKNQPEYAFIGRSNVGKSSLINSILGKKVAFTSSKPGKTQLINHFEVNKKWWLVDLPGYGYAKISKQKRKEIIDRADNYFQKRGIQLVAVFFLIDIRIKPQKIDLEKMEWLVNNNIYFIRTFTKCDKLSVDKIKKHVESYNRCMKQKNWNKVPETIITSSKNKIGKKEIVQKIEQLNNQYFDFLSKTT
ncbi:MAG: YihA family ribosome biogenesis GTP-binding protein [Flavobacteriales bacterium]|jgi:GTP-binding protein|nr:YihA family ribosome biogenesis GTP-binding protein [Flavobacteriales bacterium]|tara:strand:+ start:2665 stop:3297 length:633 start_codon:yes stop_codon:yes gene_type:complete